MNRKRLTVCADDFGLNAPVSRGIAALAERGRLSALTCIVNAPHWPQAAPALSALAPRVSIGLHLNFTEGRFQSDGSALPGLGAMLLRGAARLLSSSRLSKEIHAQWDAFEQVARRTPDFIDSHQHVHVLPQLRDALLEAVRQRGAAVAVRGLHPSFGPRDAALKRGVIRALGGAALSRAIDAAGLPRNRAFGGVQSFGPGYPVRDAWREMLRQAPDGALIACHPADAPPQSDPIGPFRLAEHDYLASDRFADDCTQAGVELAPLRAGPFAASPTDR